MNVIGKVRKGSKIRLRIRKIKRQVLVYHGTRSTRGLAFEYELSLCGDSYAVGVTMTFENGRSHKELLLGAMRGARALEFFDLCARCAVTPLNLEYVYEDFAVDTEGSGSLSSTL